MEKRPAVPTFRLLQDIQAHFCGLLGVENSPEFVVTRLREEVQELEQALTQNNVYEVRSELADVIIFAATLANCFNFSIEEDIGAKLERNFHKYNPFLSQVLRKNGLNSQELLHELRSKWNKENDKSYIR